MPAAPRAAPHARRAPDNRHRDEPGMSLGEKAQGRGDGDVGVADAVAEPVVAGPAGAIGFQGRKHGRDLPTTAVDPDVGHLPVQAPFVEQADRLVGQAGCQGGDLQRLMPRRLGGGEHRPIGRHQAVEIVQDAVALDQHLAVIQHQRRHAHERVVGADLVRIGEHRPRPMLEGAGLQRQRDADAAHERQVVLADQDHGCSHCLSRHIIPRSYRGLSPVSSHRRAQEQTGDGSRRQAPG